MCVCVWGSFELGESKDTSMPKDIFKGNYFNIKIKYLSDFGSKEKREEKHLFRLCVQSQ